MPNEVLISNYAAMSAVVTALTGWFFSRRGQILSDRAKNSNSYLSIMDTDGLDEHVKVIGKNLDLSPTMSVSIKSENVKDVQLLKAIRECLQYYEKAAISIDMGYLSEKYFYKLQKTFSERLFLYSIQYINNIRESRNSDTLYKNYEILFLRQFMFSKPYFLWILEYFTVDPKFDVFSRLMAAHLKSLDKPFGHFIIKLFFGKSLPRKIEYAERIDEIRNEYRNRIFWFNICEIISLVVLVFFLIVKYW